MRIFLVKSNVVKLIRQRKVAVEMSDNEIEDVSFLPGNVQSEKMK